MTEFTLKSSPKDKVVHLIIKKEGEPPRAYEITDSRRVIVRVKPTSKAETYEQLSKHVEYSESSIKSITQDVYHSMGRQIENEIHEIRKSYIRLEAYIACRNAADEILIDLINSNEPFEGDDNMLEIIKIKYQNKIKFASKVDGIYEFDLQGLSPSPKPFKIKVYPSSGGYCCKISHFVHQTGLAGPHRPTFAEYSSEREALFEAFSHGLMNYDVNDSSAKWENNDLFN